MWPILLISNHPARCEDLIELLGPLDRRVQLYCATTTARSLALLKVVKPMLAVVSDVTSPMQTLKAVSVLHRDDPELPILVEVPHEHPLVAIQALNIGATDCIVQPVAPWEWLHRARHLLNTQRQKRLISLALKSKGRCLLRSEEKITSQDLLNILTRADAYHDAVTGQHEQRTGRLAGLIAEGLGLSQKEIHLIEAGAGLHDVGKIGIPDKVLHKPGRYNDDDYDVMHGHPLIGYDILKDGVTPALRCGAEIALAHHERYDGGGYPYGLAGADIPLSARITAVADVFDALTVRRPYRTPMSVDDGIAYLWRERKQHFDPDCVEALRSQKVMAASIVADQ